MSSGSSEETPVTEDGDDDDVMTHSNPLVLSVGYKVCLSVCHSRGSCDSQLSSKIFVVFLVNQQLVVHVVQAACQTFHSYSRRFH